MVWIVHLDVTVRGITTLSVVLEITGVTALQDIDFRVVDPGVHVFVHGPVFGAQMFGTSWC